MAKQEKLEFDYEEYFDMMLESTAVLMWATHITSFTFAFHLNKIFGLALERRESVTLNRKGVPYECLVYSCSNNMMQTSYFLIDNVMSPLDGKRANSIFDKTLLICGPDAFPIIHDIYNSLEAPVTAKDIYVQSAVGDADMASQCRDFAGTGILESAIFDFSDPAAPDTTYFPSHSNNPAIQKKRTLFLKEQREYVTDLLLAIDHLLPTYEEENY